MSQESNQPLGLSRLPEASILGSGVLPDRDIRVGVFPERKKVPICGARSGACRPPVRARERVGAARVIRPGR